MDTMQEFLTKRESLNIVFVLIDGSIPPQIIDFDFMEVLAEDQIPFQIIVTKTDKTNQKNLHKHMTLLQKTYQDRFGEQPIVLMTSSFKGRGKEKVLEQIENLL